MEEILLHPVLWAIIAVGLVGAIIASVIIGRKRSKEVEELDKMFPEGKLAGQNLEKIPVEKVRRYSMERERRKREREKEMPKRIRPKEGEKVFADEDQEFILHPLRRKKDASSKEEMKQKPLRPRSNVSEQVNLNNTNPAFHQSQGAQDQTKSETTAKTHTTQTQTTNRRDLRTRLKPSDQINEAEAYEDQTFSSKLKPFSKTGRFQQEKTTQSGSSESPFPPRSKRNNQSSTVSQESAEEEPTQTSFASRSSKYSVRNRKRFF